MIYFVGIFPDVIDHHVRGWGRSLGDRLRVMSYAELTRSRTLPAGTYVFCDIDGLSRADAEESAAVAAHLAGKGFRTLNHPLRSLKRYELLRRLREEGVNRFEVYHATEARWPVRYPVFVREAARFTRHHGPLLRTRQELEAELAARVAAGQSRDETLIVEFCDTADDCGVYRKYSAFVVGGHVIPAHIAFSKHWMTKALDLRDEHLLAEERRFLETNPHVAQLRQVFALAAIDFGRIDYAFLDGAMQVWEINTNFWLIPWVPTDVARRPATEASARLLNAALAEIDTVAGVLPTRNPLRRAWVRARWRRFIGSFLSVLRLGRYEPQVAEVLVRWDAQLRRRLGR